MTWKLYALTSGGALAVATLTAFFAPIERNQSAVPNPIPQAVDRSGAAVDLGAQADRLKAKLAAVAAYEQPGRNAFRFAPPPRQVAATPAPPPIEPAPPVVVAPPRPPYGLAGMATSAENGTTVRTAILGSLQGVALVKEGDVLDGRYRVVSIGEDSVLLESTTDGMQTTLRLSNADQTR